jgi:hypothetical protein
MSKFMILVAGAVFVTGVVVLAQQRSEPEALPGAGAPQGSRAEPVSSPGTVESAAPVAVTGTAEGACRSTGEAQLLCLAKLQQAARQVAN